MGVKGVPIWVRSARPVSSTYELQHPVRGPAVQTVQPRWGPDWTGRCRSECPAAARAARSARSPPSSIESAACPPSWCPRRNSNRIQHSLASKPPHFWTHSPHHKNWTSPAKTESAQGSLSSRGLWILRKKVFPAVPVGLQCRLLRRAVSASGPWVVKLIIKTRMR